MLHIGPHKTGTTALQHAFHRVRTELAAHGVRYASPGRHDAEAARFAAGMSTRRGTEAAAPRWAAVAEALRDRRFPRRIFSSESLANASDEDARRILESTGPLQVVMAARSLVTLMPSQYQQFVQRGATTAPFEAWTEAVLGRRDDIDTRAFWRRHQLDAQVRRWGDLLGYDKVTVLVLDERDRRFQPSVFEQLLALPDGLLADQEHASNRSLGAEEIELLRRWHEMARQAGMGKEHRRLLTEPVRDHLQAQPDAGATRLTLAPWAATEAARRSAEIAERIAASGATVIGDLAMLGAGAR